MVFNQFVILLRERFNPVYGQGCGKAATAAMLLFAAWAVSLLTRPRTQTAAWAPQGFPHPWGLYWFTFKPNVRGPSLQIPEEPVCLPRIPDFSCLAYNIFIFIISMLHDYTFALTGRSSRSFIFPGCRFACPGLGRYWAFLLTQATKSSAGRQSVRTEKSRISAKIFRSWK